jgi:hypothetical protein
MIRFAFRVVRPTVALYVHNGKRQGRRHASTSAGTGKQVTGETASPMTNRADAPLGSADALLRPNGCALADWGGSRLSQFGSRASPGAGVAPPAKIQNS